MRSDDLSAPNLPLAHSAMSTMAEFLPGEAVWFLDHGNGENSSSKVVLNVGTENLSLIETHVQEVARYFDILRLAMSGSAKATVLMHCVTWFSEK